MLVKRDKKEKKTQKVLAMKTRIAAIYAFEQETKKKKLELIATIE